MWRDNIPKQAQEFENERHVAQAWTSWLRDMENEEEGESIESFVGGGAVENEEEGQAHQVDQALQDWEAFQWGRQSQVP